MRNAEALLTSQSNTRTAVVDLQLDDSGGQTWQKTSGLLDMGSTGGVWNLGAFQDASSRLLFMYDGMDFVPTRAVVMLEHVPTHFIDRFCVEFSGDGAIISGLSEIDTLGYTVDVNPVRELRLG